MTLIKSLLLGTATGLVVVAGAQAADLPTKKAAPAAAQYVQICNIAGVPGFIIPGSDTCLKLSGGIGVEFIDINRTGVVLPAAAPVNANEALGGPLGAAGAGSLATADRFGMDGRAWLTYDAATNTAAGPITSEAQLNFNVSNEVQGLPSNYGNGAALDHAWFKWAGLEGHVADGSLFNVGTNRAFPTDGFGAPDIGGASYLAYVAQFGGGFYAGVSVEDANGHRNFAAPVGAIITGTTYPDVAAKIGVNQGWGGAAISGIFHHTGLEAGSGNAALPLSPTHFDLNGWGVAGAVTFKPTSMITLDVSGNYTYGLSKVFSQALGGNYGVFGSNGNDIVTDAFFNGASWSVAQTWGVNGSVAFAVNPALTLAAAGTYGAINYTNSVPLVVGASASAANLTGWGAGGEATWKPVPDISFDLDVMYVSVTGTGVSNANGVLGRLQVARTF